MIKVISLLSAWIKEIILVVLFATFLELLLPSSSMKRFVRVIVGLFIMLAILNPIIHLIQNRTILDDAPVVATNAGGTADINSMTQSVINTREKVSYDIYKKELSKQMKALVMAIEGVAEAKVLVDIDNESGAKGGAIKNLVVYVKPGVSADDVKIDKVVISDTAAKQHDIKEIPPQLQSKIRNTLAELYQIPKSKIDIKPLH